MLQAVDIVELIGQTVALKRAGKDFIGLCPFHSEKTPSFHVDPAKRFFYCFGCKANGNAIDFVMKRDRIDHFREALELLARQAGVELVDSPGAKEKRGERQALLDAHSASCGYFETLLAQGEGAAAREYLTKRGFTAETLKRFRIGLAADSWDGLSKSAVARKYTLPMMALGGLVKSRDGGQGHYDTFRNRIMFPIRDESGRMIAFGGRVAPGSTDPAKYLNSPETPLFSKGRTVFGLDLARTRIVETRTVAVVEGYTDVIMAHQFGASNVVSVLGTAMTAQHVNVLRRFANRIVLLFDADSAGDAAVNRLVQLFLNQEVEIAVATLPGGLDPDEFLLEHGVEEFDKLLAGAADALAYAWRQMSRKFNASEDLTGKQKAAREYMEMLSAARGGSGPVDGLRWGQVLARVSRLTEVPIADLQRRFGRKGGGAAANKFAAKPKIASDNGQAAAAPAAVSSGPLTGVDRAERWVLGVLLAEPSRWHNVQQVVSVHDFSEDARQRLAQIYWEHQRDEGEPVFNEFLAAVGDEGLRQLAIELVDEVGRLDDLGSTLEEAMKHLALQQRQRMEQEVFAQARDGDVSALKKLQEQRRAPDLRRGVG